MDWTLALRPKLIGPFVKPTIAVLATILGGCAQNLTLQVDSDVPAALMQTLPLTVAVYYDDELRNHTYKENSSERKNWAITTGGSQVAMFDRVLHLRSRR